MFKSMTGFAAKEFEFGSRAVSLMVKSYNNRYLDISIALPPSCAACEQRIQKLIGSRLHRGKVEFTLKIKDKTKADCIVVDAKAAAAAFAALVEVARACGLDASPSLELVASQEGVLTTEGESDVEELWTGIEGQIAALLDGFERSRELEGGATADNLAKELVRFEMGFAIVEENIVGIEEVLVRPALHIIEFVDF